MIHNSGDIMRVLIRFILCWRPYISQRVQPYFEYATTIKIDEQNCIRLYDRDWSQSILSQVRWYGMFIYLYKYTNAYTYIWLYKLYIYSDWAYLFVYTYTHSWYTMQSYAVAMSFTQFNCVDHYIWKYLIFQTFFFVRSLR